MSLLKKKNIDYLNQAIIDRDSLSKWNSIEYKEQKKIRKSSLGYQENPLAKIFGLEKKKPKPREPSRKSRNKKETSLGKPKVKLFKKKGKEMAMWS